jgi:protein-S-isoprenylcysteine O-methyltransferase Ste14
LAPSLDRGIAALLRWADADAMRRGPLPTAHGVSAAVLNLALAALYALFVLRHAEALLATGELTRLATIVFETLVVAMFLVRREASSSNISALAVAATALGTFSTLFMGPIERSSVPSFLTVAIQLLGLGMAIVSLGSLGRSFGLVPANRGVKTGGMYRFVRHPLYASYLLTFLGYVLAYPAAWNVALLTASLAGQVLRMRLEERLLLRDPQYADYAARTRFRIVPGLY